MSTEAIKKAYSRSLEIWNAGDLTVIDELYAPDYVRHKMSMPDIEGPGGLKQFVSGLRTSYPDFQVTAEESLVDGNTVVLRGLWQGTQTGPSLPPPAPLHRVNMCLYRIALSLIWKTAK